ncbi:MAG: hypothetical protein ACYC4M_04375 [Thermoleophilia bacterium]
MAVRRAVIVLLVTVFALAVFSGCSETEPANTVTHSQSAKPKVTIPTQTAAAPAPPPATPPPATPAPSSPSFHGYDCTEDCSGHEAGYEWAEEHGITDPDDCGGNSDSFIEGCEAYAEEYQDEYGYDDYGDDYYEDEYYYDE